jgi:hypothetical protein
MSPDTQQDTVIGDDCEAPGRGRAATRTRSPRSPVRFTSAKPDATGPVCERYSERVRLASSTSWALRTSAMVGMQATLTPHPADHAGLNHGDVLSAAADVILLDPGRPFSTLELVRGARCQRA